MDMPFVDNLAGSNAGDIWHRYESEIRLLYQTKSLKEVKRLMEAKPGFPKLAIKTWHEKLGNHMIRKTVKNEDWVNIYRYCARYRLEDPSRKIDRKRLKRTKKPTEVIYGDRTYSWDQAWRNMKRAKAPELVGPQLGAPSPHLPLGITVRTPPTRPSSPSPRMSFDALPPPNDSNARIESQEPYLTPECSVSRERSTRVGGGQMTIQQSLLLQPSLNMKSSLQSGASSLANCLRAQMLVYLPGLPIWKLSNTIIEMADLDLPSRNHSPWEPWHVTTTPLTPHNVSLVGAAGFPITERSNESVFYLSDLFSSLTLTQSSSALATFSAGHRAYLTISTAIYLLSNNLVHATLGATREAFVHRALFETLDSIFKDMPTTHLRALLQSRLASVRAAFEALLSISGYLKQSFAFIYLVELGISNNWLAISALGHQYLCHAICMHLNETVQKLLESGCRPDKIVWYAHNRTTAIFEALKRHNIHGAQLLLKYCNVNSQFQFEDQFPITSFTFFIEKACSLDQILFDEGINLFLGAGADLSTLFIEKEEYTLGYTPVWSVLDYLFCFHPHLFYTLAPSWSLSEASKPTRAGILTSLRLGRNAMNDYCNRLAQNVGWECLYEYLELLVAEQLTGAGPWHEGPCNVVDLETVHSLVGFGVSMENVLSRAPSLLLDYMEHNWKNVDMEVIRFLLYNGTIVDDLTLEELVRRGPTLGNDFVAWLIRNTTDIRQQGPLAVVVAAISNNFDAVQMLLDAGVDVNSDFTIHEELFDRWSVVPHPQPVSVLGQTIILWEETFEGLKTMIDFLVQRGARLRLSTLKPHLFDLMECVLRYYRACRGSGFLRGMVQYIIDAGCDVSDPNMLSVRLLEACGDTGIVSVDLEGMGVFELLFRHGALLQPGAPLVAWIRLGGGCELVKEMLCRGVDIDAYHQARVPVMTALQAAAEMCSEDLVMLLLQKGANVNAAARGKWGRTALQVICHRYSQSQAEKTQQVSIINILLAYGADVNAAPARREGCTALQAAAEGGNLEVAMLLLSSDPPADVNMPPSEIPRYAKTYHNALDLAAQQGRLDMVKLLLNNNALSGSRGDTGYDGAIKAAETNGHLAVAELIREHALAVLGSNTWQTNLSQPQRDWREYIYDDYPDGYTTFSKEGVDMEDEEVDDDEFSESEGDQAPVAQLQIQDEGVEHPGFEHTASEPGFVWDMEIDESLDLNLGFSSLDENLESTYGLDYAPSSHTINTAAPGWGFGQ